MFVVLTTFFHALITPWLAPKYPKFFKNSYEPLFFDPGLSVAEKVTRGAPSRWPRFNCSRTW